MSTGTVPKSVGITGQPFFTMTDRWGSKVSLDKVTDPGMPQVYMTIQDDKGEMSILLDEARLRSLHTGVTEAMASLRRTADQFV